MHSVVFFGGRMMGRVSVDEFRGKVFFGEGENFMTVRLSCRGCR